MVNKLKGALVYIWGFTALVLYTYYYVDLNLLVKLGCVISLVGIILEPAWRYWMCYFKKEEKE